MPLWRPAPVARFLRQYFRPEPGAVVIREATYTREERVLRALVYRPAVPARRLPAWIVLHGLTYHGPRHPGLQRFASALAAAGHVVFIPEIPEWSRLAVTPALTLPTLEGAALAVRKLDDVDGTRVGGFGFSFGATHGIAAATDAGLAQHMRAVIAWGGYAEIGRLVHFGLTGEHELDGVHETMVPDPYGRWMFGGNYITSIPGYENMQRVAHGLLSLALEAGRSGIFAGDPALDPYKLEMSRGLSKDELRVYELFAPIGAHDMAAARELSKKLAETIVSRDPQMEPGEQLAEVRVPVLLAHGRDDRLVPYTESVRLRRRLPEKMLAGCTVTDLFAHSGGTEPDLGVIGLAREGTRFISVLNRILTTL